MLDEVTAIVDGYNAYFSFSKVKTGYSGMFKIAILSLLTNFGCAFENQTVTYSF